MQDGITNDKAESEETMSYPKFDIVSRVKQKSMWVSRIVPILALHMTDPSLIPGTSYGPEHNHEWPLNKELGIDPENGQVWSNPSLKYPQTMLFMEAHIHMKTESCPLSEVFINVACQALL